jgi:hypothetical protein
MEVGEEESSLSGFAAKTHPQTPAYQSGASGTNGGARSPYSALSSSMATRPAWSCFSITA